MTLTFVYSCEMRRQGKEAGVFPPASRTSFDLKEFWGHLQEKLDTPDGSTMIEEAWARTRNALERQRQGQSVWDEPKSEANGPGEGGETPLTTAETGDKEKLCPHSDDFRSVNWFGTEHGFTSYQAACMKIWYQHWRTPARDVSDATVLEAAECESKRVSDIFKRHKAWKDMIVSGTTKGTHRLREPNEERPPKTGTRRKRKPGTKK